MEVQPGYWDYERCAWVGAEPTYLLPSSRPARGTHVLTVPAQSRTSGPEAVDAGPELTVAMPA